MWTLWIYSLENILDSLIIINYILRINCDWDGLEFEDEMDEWSLALLAFMT